MSLRPNTVYDTFHFVIPILQLRKMRLRMIKWLVLISHDVRAPTYLSGFLYKFLLALVFHQSK